MLIAVIATAPGPSPGLRDSLTGFVATRWDTSASGYFERGGVPYIDAAELGFALGGDGSQEWLARALGTIRCALALEDSTVGGFFTEPPGDLAPGAGMFRKTTMNQATRIEVFLAAYSASGDSTFLKAASRTSRFLERNVLDARGGFAIGPAAPTDLIPEANGAAIRAWLRWYAITGNPVRRDFALKSLSRVWNVTWKDSLGFVRVNTFGDVLEWPNLSDQVEMGRAFVLAVHLLNRPKDLARARLIGDHVLARFSSPKGGFFNVSEATKTGGVKKSSVKRDANARAVRFLAELSFVTGDPHYREAAQAAALIVLKNVRKRHLEDAEWVLALRALERPELPQPSAAARRSLEAQAR